MSTKIFLSGVSGIGKTTLCNLISKNTGLPFIEGSSKVLWRDFNIGSHKELIDRSIKDPKFGLDFQYALLDYREKLIKENPSFITDRSPLDNIVYTIIQLGPSISSDETLAYIQRAKSIYKNIEEEYQHIHLGLNNDMLGEILVENDGMRIPNFYYQLMVEGVFKTCLESNWLGIRNLSKIYSWDMDRRENLVLCKISEIIKHQTSKNER